MMACLQYFRGMIVAVFVLLPLCSPAFAGGMFGPPQTISKKAGGLNTAVAYQYVEDVFEGSSDYVIRQHQVYSHAAYGVSGLWEVYGRIGMSDLKLSDAFNSTDIMTTVAKSNFEESWKIFGTLGAKAFYPVNDWLGIGAFVQGTYHFSTYKDNVTGSHNGTFFEADLRIKHLRDINGGVALQATLPRSVRLYGGPYGYYSEADTAFPADVAGMGLGHRNARLESKSAGGGFFGADIPLFKGFRLNIEGQYTRRLSAGAAVTYTY